MLSVMEIGDRVALARKMKNLTQAQLAELLAVSAQAVGKWERGESMPDIVTFQRLAEALGLDLNYFGGGQGMSADISNALPTRAQEEAVQKQGWDMSRGNWVDADFSGLCDLAEKFAMANIERCLFVGSELSGLALKGNNIVHSDFSSSDLRGCTFSGTNIEDDTFVACKADRLSYAFMKSCKADLSDVEIIEE